MSYKIKKRYIILLLALALAIAGCSLLTTTKRYELQVKVKCPDGSETVSEIPEVILR